MGRLPIRETVDHEQIDSLIRHEDQRSLFLMTSFSPDHVSVTAQTLTSTNPSGSATARIESSVTSVATPDDFFGHEIQTKPAGSSASLKRGSVRSRSRRAFVNR